MQRIPLAEFVKAEGQAVAAERLGCTQGAISKALRSGREIFVTRRADGAYEASELRPFPAKKSAA